jgi:hypothetical protein
MKEVLVFDPNNIVDLLMCLKVITRYILRIDIYQKTATKNVTNILSFKNLIRYERYEKFYNLYYEGYNTMLEARTARKVLNKMVYPGLVPINTNNVINVCYLQCLDSLGVHLKHTNEIIVPSRAGRQRLEKYLNLCYNDKT